MSLIHDVAATFQSLHTWVDIIQANIEGTRRIGYKGTQVSFQSQRIDYPYRGTVEQRIPSAYLSIAYTSPDLTQGSLVPSSDRNHLAINGTGFFMVSDSLDGDRKIFFTRDGEFHWDGEGYLRTNDGLYVLDATAATDASRAMQSAIPWSGGFNGSSFKTRELIRFENNTAAPLAAGSVVDISLNTQSLISQGKMANTTNDLHVVYWNGSQLVELASQVTNFGLSNTNVKFQIPDAIAPAQFAENVFIYYGSDLPPARVNGAFGASSLSGELVSRNGAILRASEEDLLTRIGLAKIQSPSGLMFTKYGATVLELPWGGFTQTNSLDKSVGDLHRNALEQSNTSLSAYLPLLMHVQRLYQALAKIISMHNAAIDDVNATIR